MKLATSRWFVLLNLLGLAVLFAALQWNTYTMPFERDEGEYAYSAWIMKEGLVPYRDSFLQKPPMIVYTYLLGQVIDAHALWPPRMLASLFTLLAAFLIGALTKELHGARAGWISVWLFLLLSMLPIFLPYAANTERFLLLPILGVLYLFVRFGASAPRWVWAVAGFAGFVAVLYKQVAVVPVACIGLLWLIDTWKQYHSFGACLRRGGIALLSGAVTLLLVLGFFIWRNVLSELIQCTVTFNYFYGQVEGYKTEFFGAMMGFLAEQWWPLLILLVFYFLNRPRRWGDVSLLFALSLAIASQDINGHYYILMVPFLAIMCAGGLEMFFGWIESKVRADVGSARLRFAVSAFLIAVLFLPLRGTVFLQPNALSELVYPGNPFVESSIVANRVRELLPANQRLFIAGSEPQILYESKRLSLTRFDLMYPLTMPTPFARQYQEAVITALRDSLPRVVVVATSQTSWFYQLGSDTEFPLQIQRMLDSLHYEFVGGFVRDENGSRWEEPISRSRVQLCSLVLLKRE